MAHEDGRRIAAFGNYAGYAGAVVILIAWSHQIIDSSAPLGTVPLYPSAPTLAADIKIRITSALAHNDGK